MQLYDAVKERVSLLDVAQRYAGLELHQKGARYWARCPFHEDRTPSLMDDAAGRYHCFSCNASGSVIDFLATYLKVSPLEAAQRLAQDYGVITNKENIIRRSSKPLQPVKREDERVKLYRLICDAKHRAQQYQQARAGDWEAALDDEMFWNCILLVGKAETEWLNTLEYGTDAEADALAKELQAAIGG